MTLQDIMHEAQSLSTAERRELINLLVDTLADSEMIHESEPTHEKRVLWNLQDLARKLGRVLMLKNTSTSFEVNGIIVRDHS